MIFLPSGLWGVTVGELEESAGYGAFWFNPVDGSRVEIGIVSPTEDGTWESGQPPIFQDWVLVLEQGLGVRG
jgi:hypothetical protein